MDDGLSGPKSGMSKSGEGYGKRTGERANGRYLGNSWLYQRAIHHATESTRLGRFRSVYSRAGFTASGESTDTRTSGERPNAKAVFLSNGHCPNQ